MTPDDIPDKTSDNPQSDPPHGTAVNKTDNTPDSAPALDAQWFYALDQRQHGPISFPELREMLIARSLDAGDLVWTAGMPQWLPIQDVSELADVIANLPPLAVESPQLNYGLAPSNYIDRRQLDYATFGQRFVAYLIDSIILRFASAIVEFGIATTINLLVADRYRPESWAVASTTGTITTCLGWLYFAWMESSPRRATFGKMAMGLIVTDLVGGPITFGRASGRYFAKILSGLVFCLGYFAIMWTPNHQGWHDKMAGTLVLKRPK